MARRKSRTLTELELAIMQVVWGREEITVEELRQALKETGRALALSSVRTMLGILLDKGYVMRRRLGRGHAYRAVVGAEQAEKSMAQDMIDRVYNGSAANFVAALLSQGLVRKHDLVEARRLIREHRALRGQ